MHQSARASVLIALVWVSLVLVGCRNTLVNNPESTSLASDDTSTLHSPTSTVVPPGVNSSTEEPERIEFPPHTSSTSLKREFAPYGTAEFAIRAVEGQWLMGGIYDCDGLVETVYSVKDDLEIVRGSSPGSTGYWSFLVRTAQDYIVKLENGSVSQSCTLYFALPQHITFAPDATSVSIAGDITGPDGNDVYALDIDAGQSLAITVTSSSNDVCLSIVDPGNWQPIAQSLPDTGTTGWAGNARQVRASYLVVAEMCKQATSRNASYTLEVSVTD